MPTEKILIQNFAGIREMEIEVKKINILIGPQASGKSIVAKLLFYFKGFLNTIFIYGIQQFRKNDLDKELREKFFLYFPPDSWSEKDFTVKYSSGEEYIEITRKASNRKNLGLSLQYSKIYKDGFYSLKRLSKKIDKKIEEEEIQIPRSSRSEMFWDLYKSFLDDIEEELGGEFTFTQFFIPAGRSFFSNLKKNIFLLLSENENILDPFLMDFGRAYESLKERLDFNRIRAEGSYEKYILDDVKTLKYKILSGQYLKIGGEDYLKMDDGRMVELSNCSSGQQESFPLTLIVENLLFFNRGPKGQTVYIEEPEAHLFPAAQRDIVDLISTVYNLSKEQLQFFITTHSPYILTSLNNLLQAGMLATDSSQEHLEKIESVVSRTRFLYPSEIAVYSLNNGECVSIIEPETGLIDAEMIDSVSEDLAVQFDNLLEIE